MKFQAVLLFLLWSGVCCGQRALFRCINLYSKDTCFALFNSLQRSLLNSENSERNHFELTQAFFPIGLFASTALVNVLYTVEFFATNESSIPSRCYEVKVRNSSAIVVNSTERFSVGWSSSGVFNILSPIQLSELQLQILNEIYSLFIVPGGGIFLPGKFGWKVRNVTGGEVEVGQRNIAELSLNLNLSELTCTPDKDLVMAVLQDITVLVNAHSYINNCNSYTRFLKVKCCTL